MESMGQGELGRHDDHRRSAITAAPINRDPTLRSAGLFASEPGALRDGRLAQADVNDSDLRRFGQDGAVVREPTHIVQGI
jgi:hypothetical protein